MSYTIAELWESFKADANEKGRSSFFGAFVISWSFRNWKLLFTLFNFDSDYTLNDKTASIQKYIDDNSICGNLLLNPIAYAFIGVLAFYFLNYIFKAISLFHNRRAIPWLSSHIPPHDMIARSLYKTLEKKYDALFEKDSKSIKIQNDLEIANTTIKEESLRSLDEYKRSTKDRDEFIKLFSGRWRNEYTFKDGDGKDKTESEDFEINYNGQDVIYILYRHKEEVYPYGKETFKIENIKFHTNQIDFTKVRLEGNQIFIDTLAYDRNNPTNSFRCTERDSLKKDSLSVIYEKIEKGIKNPNSLQDLMPGMWQVGGINSINNTSVSFSLQIKANNQWWENGKYLFNIDMLEFDDVLLKFRKTDINNKDKMHINILQKTESNEYIGVEYYNTGEVFALAYTHFM